MSAHKFLCDSRLVLCVCVFDDTHLYLTDSLICYERKAGAQTDLQAYPSSIMKQFVVGLQTGTHKLEAAPQVIWIYPLQRSTTGKLAMGCIFSLRQQWANNTVDVWICTVYLNLWLAFLGSLKERLKNWHSHKLRTDVMCHQSSKIQHERRWSHEMVKRDSGKMVKRAMNHLFSQNEPYRKKKVSLFLDQSLLLNNRDDRWPTWWCHQSPSYLPLKNIQGPYFTFFLFFVSKAMFFIIWNVKLRKCNPGFSSQYVSLYCIVLVENHG